jgi:DNA-binding IclR family transcriptional regulator
VAELSSLEKGLLILRELASSERGLTVADLARLTGLNRTTVHRLSEILRREGWVYRLTDGDEAARLDVGPAMQGLAILIANKYDTESQLQPLIEGVARSLGETVHVGSLQGAQIVHVGRALPESSFNIAARLGSREFAHAAALGKVLLATHEDEEVRALVGDHNLVQRTPNTVTSVPKLLQELHDIRRLGYAIDNEESRVGVKCVAAPVFDSSGHAILAISITSVPQRLAGDRFTQVLDVLLGTTSLATASFGGVFPADWRRPPSSDNEEHRGRDLEEQLTRPG